MRASFRLGNFNALQTEAVIWANDNWTYGRMGHTDVRNFDAIMTKYKWQYHNKLLD